MTITDNLYNLQRELEDNSIPDNISLLPTELKSSKILDLLHTTYKSILPVISNNNELIPLLHSYTSIPVECNIQEIQSLLRHKEEVHGTFFDTQKSVTEGEVSGFVSALTGRSAHSGSAHGSSAHSNSTYGISAHDKTRSNSTYGSNKDIDTESNIDTYILDKIKNEILENVTDVQWDDIVGLDNVKRIVNEIVLWPMQRPDLFTGLRGPPKGLMLFGPPGTGKTMIGKCIASQCNATFFSISASSLTSKWVGEGEKMVRALFYLGRKMQPSVIFIDEIDSLLSQRSENENEGSRRIKTEFLVQFDGTATDNNDKILVIGATNRPQEIDEAARRRLVKRIYVNLPDSRARIQMVSNLVKTYKNVLVQEDYDKIGEMTEGYSGSDMFNLCREASLEPLREIGNIKDFKQDDTREINVHDFVKAVRQIKKSVSSKDLELYKEWNEVYGSF